MSLADTIKLGMAIPQAFIETPVDMNVVRNVCQRSEALGFESLWTSSAVFGDSAVLEPLGLLSYAAGITSTVRLGVSVLVFPLLVPVVINAVTATNRIFAGRPLGEIDGNMRILAAMVLIFLLVGASLFRFVVEVLYQA